MREKKEDKERGSEKEDWVLTDGTKRILIRLMSRKP